MPDTNGPYVMTIDVGTGSGRALIFDSSANQVAVAQREWISDSLPEHPGAAVFDTTTSWSLICECIAEVLERADLSASQIQAVTATSMREGMVLYDDQQREIWAYPNIDARASAEAEQLVADGLADRIYDTAGDWLGIISPPRFRWIAAHQPEIYDRMRSMSMISDWVVMRLSGEIVTDPSCGSSAGLFDLSRSTWSEDLLSQLDLPPRIFPPIHAPGTVVGPITHQAAAETGLAAGTAVVVGGADTQLALLGTGGVRPHRLTIVGGTFWQTTWLSEQPLIDSQKRLRTLCHVVPDVWMTEGIGFLNGLAMRWLRDTVCRSTDGGDGDATLDQYAAMENLASQVPPGAEGVFALVSDVMNAQRWIQAPTSFLGLDVTNPNHAGKRGQGLMVRAVQESAAITAWGHYEILQALSGTNASEMIFCGGASKGRLWPQIMADLFNLPVHIPKVAETTSLGGALCALVGIQEQSSLTEAAENLVQWDRSVEPIAEHVASYRDVRRQALDLQRGLIEWVDQGRLQAMWRGAGAVKKS